VPSSGVVPRPEMFERKQHEEDEAEASPDNTTDTMESGRRFRRRGLRVDAKLGRGVSISCDLRELLRYTPVAGLQPGVLCEWGRTAATSRPEILLDTGVNLGSGSTTDWLIGARVRAPSWSLAEAGVQVYDLTDTSDQWRTDRLQSSLSFALQNRPDVDYFRREGMAAFMTAQISPRLLLGVEYRLDEYASLPTRDGLWILPEDLEVPWRNPAVKAGRMGSAVLRFEWSSAPIPMDGIDGARRHSETSLVSVKPLKGDIVLRTLNTIEIARPALGSDGPLAFTRIVSDHSLIVDRGRLRGVRLRARLAGGSNLPPQKEEGLGGWSAVRGYAFKRYRGDWSISGTVEHRRGCLAAFFDAGAVRELAGWTGLLASVGARVYVFRALNVGAAWRIKGPGMQLFPSVRLLLSDGW
jgi:hypothetical protein